MVKPRLFFDTTCNTPCLFSTISLGATKRLAEDIAKFALSGIYDPVDALEKLVKLDSSHYMLATSEVLANLRWLRQFIDAVRD